MRYHSYLTFIRNWRKLKIPSHQQNRWCRRWKTRSKRYGPSTLILERILYVLSQQKEREKEKKDENQLAKSVKDRCVIYPFPWIRIERHWQPNHLSTKIAVEAQHGLISQVLKDVIFSMRPSKISETDMAIGWTHQYYWTLCTLNLNFLPRCRSSRCSRDKQLYSSP